MDILFLLLVAVSLIGIFVIFDNRSLRREKDNLENTISDLLIERDGLRVKLKKALKNDYRIKGKYAKRPA